MAFYASFTRPAFIRKSAMQPAMLLQLRGNLAVAFGTAKRSLAHRLGMALCAVSRSLQIVMWTRQRSGRDLRMRRRGNSTSSSRNTAMQAFIKSPLQRRSKLDAAFGFVANRTASPHLGRPLHTSGKRVDLLSKLAIRRAPYRLVSR